jgi:hypothetical protein
MHLKSQADTLKYLLWRLSVMPKGTLMGLGLFADQILKIISIGAKEPVDVIEKHIDAKNIVDYIYRKYGSHFYMKFDGIVYDNDAISEYFSNYGDTRKFGLSKDDGLLLIIAIIMSKVEMEAVYWKP